jgi:hypothetical protein
MDAFERFLTFFSSQELEMAPYMLIAAAVAFLLHRQSRLKPQTYLPGLIFFIMAQVSLLAFILSPSTPYRAMTATYFYIVLCSFAFIVNLEYKGHVAKILYAVFCIILLSSVLAEVKVFIQAQPTIDARDEKIANGEITAREFSYPSTDKYFFPCFDIIEINGYTRDDKKFKMVPWDKAVPLNLSGGKDIRALTICNVIYLDDVPQGKVHIAAVARNRTLASAIQSFVRWLSPLKDSETTSSDAIELRYVPASETVSSDGKAIIHIPGVTKLSDIAYIAVAETECSLTWRRVSIQSVVK